MEGLASGAWLTRERVTAVAAISGSCGLAMLLFLWLARHGTLDPFGTPLGSDFTAFWNAGRIADSAHPQDAWNQQLLNDAIRRFHGADYGAAWIYPPLFLFVAAPLGALPYLPALLAWQALSLLALTLVLRALLPTRRDVAVAIASPLSALVLANGQNSFLTAGLLGGGLIWLDRRPLAAGSLFGCLAYKPQLALVIGPLLLVTRAWRALAAAAATTAALIAASIALWGTDCWPAWQASLRFARFYMEQGSVGFYKSASLFAMVREWGAPSAAAYAAQLVGVAAALWLLWCSSRASSNLRAAAVCAAAALSTPYLLDYDMAVVGLGGAFLYAEARWTGFLPLERSALAFLWAAPWFSRPAAQYAALPLGPMAMALLGWFAWRRMRQGMAIPPLTCSVCPVT